MKFYWRWLIVSQDCAYLAAVLMVTESLHSEGNSLYYSRGNIFLAELYIFDVLFTTPQSPSLNPNPLHKLPPPSTAHSQPSACPSPSQSPLYTVPHTTAPSPYSASPARSPFPHRSALTSAPRVAVFLDQSLGLRGTCARFACVVGRGGVGGVLMVGL